MKVSVYASLIMAILIAWPVQKLWAYPEYAVRYNINACTACHLSPVGGGPRTIYGKLFGAHNFAPSQITMQEYVSADFRVLYYYPQRVSRDKGGVGIMSGSIGLHAPLDEKQRVHLVIEHNIAGFAAAPLRDTYALIQLTPNEQPSFSHSLLVGRFRAPFGIIIDEHRTYTRVATATEWFTFESGVLLSGDSHNTKWHYDLAVVNGEKNTGQNLNQGQAAHWGTIANVRYLPGPILLGLSASYHNHKPANESPWATSLYALFSLGRMTNDLFPVTFQLEYVSAWGWNDNLARGFISNASYATSLARTQSQGWLAITEWHVSNRLALIYKLIF